MMRRSGFWLLLIVAAAAAFRFTGLAWGAPYFHFHMDEHFVMQGADYLRQGLKVAADSPKFFMYGPLPMWMLDGVRWVWERWFGALNLTVDRDEVVYMVMGRAISATLGTLTVPLVYVIAKRVAGKTAGLIAAFLLAASVVHLRESHFFSVDVTMVFFCTVAWWFAQRIAARGRLSDYVWAGAAAGAAIACKYSALFLFGVIGVAHLATLAGASRPTDARGWMRWLLRGLTPLVVAGAVFVAVDPMAVMYWSKFKDDVRNWVIDPGSGARQVIFTSQFADLTQPRLYWFTNLLWWGLGPLFEAAGLVGVLWLLVRRDRHALVAASFAIFYYVAASQTTAPHIRYAAPLAAGLAVPAGVFLAELMTRSRVRIVATIVTLATCATTGLYAAAYMNVFTSPDVRLAAAQWLVRNVPEGSRILVEPSQNVVPMGDYRTHVDFTKSYVPFALPDGSWRRMDYYDVNVIDTYRYLYHPGIDDRRNESQKYLDSRLALGDWIVMDDTYVQFYDHLPEATHGVTKQYYRDLFGGRLPFRMVQTFKVYPKLFGIEINDDAAELSFRLFDHPRIFVFKRE